MRDQRNKLIDKIAMALKRRQGRGLSAQQVNKAARGGNHAVGDGKFSPHKKMYRKDHANRPFKSMPHSGSMFITASIGDLFALESFFTDEDRRNTSTIYYATQKSKEISSLLSSLPNMPLLKNHIEIWTDFSHFWCFYSKEDFLQRHRVHKKPTPDGFKLAKDFSIGAKFNEVTKGQLVYNGSSFLKYHMADVSKFNLPSGFVVVCPYSNDKRVNERDFNDEDWNNCLEYLKRVGMKGVVINAGSDTLPQSNLLIDLSNQTTLAEAIEVLKAASGYVGIDSCFSVLAAKLFAYPRLLIKSVNDHCYASARCYFAPQTSFDFLVRSIVVPDNLEKPLVKIDNIPSVKRSIVLNVCQGVGDILWVYQKFFPHVNEIRFCISRVPHGSAKEQSRAMEFLRLLPKVMDVRYRVISHQEYEKLMSGHWPMRDIMDKLINHEIIHFDYCCNNHLERGVRLEAIDPDYPIEETFEMMSEPYNLPIRTDRYMTLYVSGGTMVPEMTKIHALWNIQQWKQFVQDLYQKYELDMPIILIGASYDQPASTGLCEQLRRSGIDTHMFIDLEPINVVDIIKNSSLYVGYQSGLNVIADNFNVRQIMMYFPSLHKMQYAWCKKQNKIDGIFNADTFDKTPRQVLDNLNLNILDNKNDLA